jgi:hypothetical protein
MQTLVIFISLLLTVIQLPQSGRPKAFAKAGSEARARPAAKQLFAVRGLITGIKMPSKGELQLTIQPAKDFPEVSVLVRRNEPVGSAARRTADRAGVSLLGGSSEENEIISAAELAEGDLVSVIYDPQAQNRALEIYLH